MTNALKAFLMNGATGGFDPFGAYVRGKLAGQRARADEAYKATRTQQADDAMTYKVGQAEQAAEFKRQDALRQAHRDQVAAGYKTDTTNIARERLNLDQRRYSPDAIANETRGKNMRTAIQQFQSPDVQARMVAAMQKYQETGSPEALAEYQAVAAQAAKDEVRYGARVAGSRVGAEESARMPWRMQNNYNKALSSLSSYYRTINKTAEKMAEKNGLVFDKDAYIAGEIQRYQSELEALQQRFGIKPANVPQAGAVPPAAVPATRGPVNIDGIIIE
jgi:hypothetical protein